jgi:hypothetical protein
MVLSKTMSMVVSGFVVAAGIALGPGAVNSADAAVYLGLLPHAHSWQVVRIGNGGDSDNRHHHEVGALNRFHIADLAHNNNVSEDILIHKADGTVKRVTSGVR